MNAHLPARTRWSTSGGAARIVTLLSGALVLVLAGCSAGSGAERRGTDATAPTTRAGQGGLGDAPGTDPSETSGPERPPAAGPTRTSGSTGGGDTGPSSAPQPPGPEIVSLRIRQAAKCPAGTSAYPVPAVPLVIEWKVTGVDQVTLSVDGPGAYGTYPAQGSESFTFSCGGAPGTVEKHIYTVRATADGIERSKTLTAVATVNEIPQV